MDIHRITSKGLTHTAFWGLVVSCTIVVVVAILGRAALNISAALTEKPDIAVYLLLQEEGIEVHDDTLLRELPYEQDYLVDTDQGPKFVKIRKSNGEWRLVSIENLRE